MSILDLIRPELLNSQNYVPGGDNVRYRLHANELPWSPINQTQTPLNEYPGSQLQLKIQATLADRYSIQNDQLVLTRGSDEGIDLIARLFLTAGKDALMQFPPAFPMYAFYVRLQQAELIQCPLDEHDFSISLDSIEKSWRPNCKVIMLCSPNNPTGNLIDLNLIAATCERFANKSVVVVDEAYIEFANAQSAVTLISQYDNLIVLRTLSKACGLAGLRLGTIIAQAQVIAAFRKIIPPFTISTAVSELAALALKKEDWYKAVVLRIQKERQKLIYALQSSAVIEKIYPSETNFILVKSSYAKELTVFFAKKGIAVRDFPPNSLLHQHLRITVGDEEQNQVLIDTLSSFYE
jgi:histidinol-phosphate aminotransferase